MAQGPPSPTRRQPNRRRSSLMRWQQATASSSSPTSPSNDPNAPRSHDFATQSRPPSYPSRPSYLQRLSSRASSGAPSEASFAGGAGEVYHEARRVFGRGTPSPYFMAAVSFLTSLVQGLPLASMFKVYTYLVCEVYEGGRIEADEAKGRLTLPGINIPNPPTLPHPPQCNDPQVAKTTSAYAAAMATGGALVALVLLNRVTRLSRRVGRKPMLLIPCLGLALGFASFRLAVALPSPYAGAAVLAIAIVCLEASAAGPLKVGLQSYVVDTTTESQRAAALGFIDGAGQLGAFPSSTLGGFLAAITGQFFAPFYVAVGLAALTFFYVLVLVPESKRHRMHTFIDDWEHSAETEGRERDHGDAGQRQAEERQQQQQDGAAADGDEEQARQPASRRASYQPSDTGGSDDQSAWTATDLGTEPISRSRAWLRRLNFLAPLAIFAPRRSHPNARLDWRLPNLALIVVLEEIYQVFLVPMLLLYNSDVLGFDVLSNGYLVSLLQGCRALFLTAVFPPAVAAARRWVSAHVQRRRSEQKRRRKERARKKANGSQARGEEEPLLGGAAQENESNGEANGAPREEDASSEFTSTTAVAKAEERGKLDIFLMVGSYALATGSFLTLALSNRLSSSNSSTPARFSPWLFLCLGIVGIQLASGATSVRTALIVNSVSSPQSTHSNHDQSRALAANQVLCSAVYATIPLITSLVYGAGLAREWPEAVWLFKAGFAGMACVASLGLFVTHRAPRKGTTGHSEEQQED